MVDNRRNILAALFARSNMGMANPSLETLGALKHSKTQVTVDAAVYYLCGEFMEDDETEKIFVEEGRWWRKEMEKQEGACCDLVEFYEKA